MSSDLKKVDRDPVIIYNNSNKKAISHRSSFWSIAHTSNMRFLILIALFLPLFHFVVEPAPSPQQQQQKQAMTRRFIARLDLETNLSRSLKTKIVDTSKTVANIAKFFILLPLHLPVPLSLVPAIRLFWLQFEIEHFPTRASSSTRPARGARTRGRRKCWRSTKCSRTSTVRTLTGPGSRCGAFGRGMCSMCRVCRCSGWTLFKNAVILWKL